MARDEAPPFARGETYYNGTVKDAAFSDPLNYLGREYVFEVNAPDGYTQADSTGRWIRVKVVQNKAGIALKAGRIARWKKAAPLETVTDGYWFQASDLPAGVIDEFLPPAGVPDGDLFYLIIDGPTSVISQDTTSIAIGDRLEVVTGTSATNADAGLVNKYASSPTTADVVKRIGFAEAAVSTATTMFKAVAHFSATR